MGENNKSKDQKVKQTQTDRQQVYGSQQYGRHNLEGTSPNSTEEFIEESNYKPSLEQQNPVNWQTQDSQGIEKNSDDYEIDDDRYENDHYTSRSQLNEMEDENMVNGVEGDYEDILGETENSQRNQQRMREKESNQGNS